MTVMAETTFEVKYDGEALRDGRMPVRDLAPALLALGQLFTEASQLLYPENDPVSLEIEATKQGSFSVDLILHASQMGWDQISSMSVTEGFTALYVFKDFVIGDSADLSLFKLIKWLKGRRIVKEEEGPEPGTTTLRTEDGSEIIVKAEVAGLNRDPRIRRKVRDVVEPLRKDGVDTIEFRSDSQKAVELEKDDVPAFEVPDDQDDEVVSRQEIDVYLEVLTADLEEGSGRKWRFGGLGQTFMATIEDPQFMEKVARHEEVFGSGDQLHATVEIVQRRDPATGKIRAERRIVKVHDVLKAPEQLSLQERTDQIQKRLDGESDAEAS
ncbi:MAG: hypothetical protein AB7V58_02260 [Solirubrobacterales bacterium]